MNERIRELAEQATEYANEQNELHGVDYVMTFKEKFAELIVKECLAQVFCDSEDEYRITDSIYERIEKHFGVE
jgi:hypothetical protein